VLAVDFLSLLFSVYLAYALRLTFFISGGFWKEMAGSGLCFAVTITAVLWAGKVYMIVWPQASVEEYARLFKWYCLGVILFSSELYFSKQLFIPRSSLAILLLVAILILAGVRASWRLLLIYRNQQAGDKKRALIVGAGDAGTLIARDLARHDASLLPVGFIDDDQNRWGMISAGIPVLGGREQIKDLIIQKEIDTVLIAMPSATGAQIKAYIDILAGLGVTVRVLPSIADLADGQVNVSRLRSVKLEDLLRRDPIKLDNPGIANLVKDRTVLVTGAGGSIGSEICRQILAKGPKQLLALGHGENSIYQLLESLNDAGNKIPVQPIIADVADKEAMKNVFEQYRPEIIFHAAAHKHVPLMEYNPKEALRVNAFGTWNLASLAGQYKSKRMVMISTDKAVRPTSVMGATKRIAERLLLSAQAQYQDTRYMAVRFGNVLGSRGSVVPKFERQIEKGGPVTVTHKDMKRYFMLIPEAVSLVLQAGAMGKGGELFVLDMGEPVNITEMAETLIKLHGHEPYKDIKIEFTGVRPGEKLYEELFYDPAHVDKTTHEKIFLMKMGEDRANVLDSVERIINEPAGELREGIFALGSDAN